MPTNDRLKDLFKAQNTRQLEIPTRREGISSGFNIAVEAPRGTEIEGKATTSELLAQARVIREGVIKKLKEDIFSNKGMQPHLGEIDKNYGNTEILRNSSLTNSNYYTQLANSRQINQTRNFTSKKPIFGQ